MINILIVEDSVISQQLFEQQLAGTPDYRVLASLENAANAEIACMRCRVDLILMDVCTADDESGLAAAARIRKRYPAVKIIMMTSMPEHSFLEKARKAGADSFWYKEQKALSLPEICGRTLKGERVWPDRPPVLAIGLAASDEFTGRELEIIRELAAGGHYEEIARDLHLSTNTVKYHIKNILQKTGFHTTIQLVAEVVGKRLVLPKY